MTFLRNLAVASALTTTLAATTADAAVKGGTFTGTVINSSGEIFTRTDSFGNDGSYTLVELGNTFYGTYTEQNGSGPGVTTWQARGQDGTPDGYFDTGGTCYFGLVTTVYLTNDQNGGVTSWGILVRSGSTRTSSSSATAPAPSAAAAGAQ